MQDKNNNSNSDNYDVEDILMEARKRRARQQKQPDFASNLHANPDTQKQQSSTATLSDKKSAFLDATSVLPKLTVNIGARGPAEFDIRTYANPKPNRPETPNKSDKAAETPIYTNTERTHKQKQRKSKTPEYDNSPTITLPLKTINQVSSDTEPLSDGLRPWGSYSKRAPHALTSQELLKGNFSPSDSPQKSTLKRSFESQSFETKPLFNKQENKTFAEAHVSESSDIPDIHPLMRSCNIADKTLHLEPVEQSAPCKNFKTPTGEACQPSSDLLPKIKPNHTPLAKTNSPNILTKAEIEEIQLKKDIADLNQRKRESFEQAVKTNKPIISDDFILSEPRFHSSSTAEPAPPEPKDSFFITTPINLPQGEDFLLQPQRNHQRAKAKIRLFDGEEEDNLPGESPIFPDDDANVIDDFENMEDAPAIRADLAVRKRKMLLKILFTGVSFIFLALISIFPLLSVDIPMISAETNPQTYLMIHIGILALACIVNLSTMRGLLSLISFSPDFDSAVALSSSVALLHSIYLLASSADFASLGISSYAAAALLGLLFSAIGKLYMLTRISENFEEVATVKPKYSAFILEDQKLANDSSAQVTLGDPLVCCTRETAHLKNFLYYSFSEDPADTLCSRLAPVSLLCAAVAFGASMIITSNLAVSLTALSAVMCIFSPITSLIAGHFQMFLTARNLKEEDAMLSGFDSVAEFCYTSALVADAKDLFPGDNIALHSVRTCGNMPIDQVILDCASVAIASNSALSELFDKVIEGQRSILPKVQSLDYEDGCGISGFVSGRGILVGNRELCTNHNIPNLPDPDFESKILRSGKYPVYLASGGELAAIFIVAYEPDPDIAEALSKLISSGVSLLISTSDPNVTDGMVCKYFGLPREAVKVLPADISARLHKETRKTKSDSALLSHKGSLSALAYGIRACIRLRGNFSFILIAQIALICLGAVIGLSFLVAGNALWMSVPLLVAYQIISVILVLIILGFRRP